MHSTVSAVLYHCDRFYSVSATDGMGSLWMDFVVLHHGLNHVVRVFVHAG